MKPIKVKTKTEITLDDKPINDILQMAADMAHEVLEELSIYRQKYDLDPLTFRCEGLCCKFLDIIED